MRHWCTQTSASHRPTQECIRSDQGCAELNTPPPPSPSLPPNSQCVIKISTKEPILAGSPPGVAGVISEDLSNQRPRPLAEARCAEEAAERGETSQPSKTEAELAEGSTPRRNKTGPWDILSFSLFGFKRIMSRNIFRGFFTGHPRQVEYPWHGWLNVSHFRGGCHHRGLDYC